MDSTIRLPDVWRSVAESLGHAIVVSRLEDDELRIVLMNPAAEKLFEMDTASAHVDGIAFLTERASGLVQAAKQVAVLGGGFLFGDFVLGAKSGDDGVFSVEVFALPDRHVGLCLSDVTMAPSTRVGSGRADAASRPRHV